MRQYNLKEMKKLIHRDLVLPNPARDSLPEVVEKWAFLSLVPGE
jgi:hypothetical protein